MPEGKSLRAWNQEFHREDMPDVSGQSFVESLLSECRLSKVTDARFINCDLFESSLEPATVSDLLGVTATLDCYTFDGLALNELALCSLLFLLSRTRGNDEIRAAMRAAIPSAMLARLERSFERLGRP